VGQALNGRGLAVVIFGADVKDLELQHLAAPCGGAAGVFASLHLAHSDAQTFQTILGRLRAEQRVCADDADVIGQQTLHRFSRFDLYRADVDHQSAVSQQTRDLLKRLFQHTNRNGEDHHRTARRLGQVYLGSIGIIPIHSRIKRPHIEMRGQMLRGQFPERAIADQT